MSKRSAMSALGKKMRRMTKVNAYADKTKMPLDEASDKLKEIEHTAIKQACNKNQERLERRDFIKKLGLTAGAVMGSQLAFGNGNGNSGGGSNSSNPDVAVIGGGLAGLRAAHRLLELRGANNTVDVRIYEGNNRLGGRCYTKRGYFDDNVHAEIGGQLIDTPHTALHNLVQQLGLDLETVVWRTPQYTGGWDDVVHVNDHYYPMSQARQDWVDDGVWQVFKDTLHNAPWGFDYTSYNSEHLRLDYLPVKDWLDQTGIGSTTDMGKLLLSTNDAEWTSDPNVSPALNLLYLLGWNNRNIDPLSASDLHWQVVGGMDNVVHAMAAEIGEDRIELNKELVAISGDFAGPYTLSFSDGSEVTAPKIVLALPFSTLRDVDIDPRIWNGMRPEKQDNILNSNLGQVNKMHVQFDNKFYYNDILTPEGVLIDSAASFYTEQGDPNKLGCAWEEIGGQYVQNPTDKGLLIHYAVQNRGRLMNTNGLGIASSKQDVDLFLDQLDVIMPGAHDNVTGGNRHNRRKAISSNWINNKWSKGAYTAQTIGHWTRFYGSAHKVEGNIHFAGEHANDLGDGSGFMNSAIISGERAAVEIHQS